jgi:hypothetical protein
MRSGRSNSESGIKMPMFENLNGERGYMISFKVLSNPFKRQKIRYWVQTGMTYE